MFKAFFNKEFRELQEIKGEKVPFEVFDKIMQNVDINKFSKFNKLLEEDFERSINFRKRFGNLGESFKLGEYSIRADEYKSLEEIRKKFYKGKTFEELLEYSRIKVSQFEENYRVTYLNLSKLDLEEIPEELNVFTQLEKLFLWGNKIKEIENLDNLKNLKKLYLMKNKISEIQGLDNLVELQELYLGYNALSDWSLKETLNLPQLQILNLDFNGGFYDVEHKTFKNLKQLKKLSIRTGGMLHRINVENLTELETLNLEVQALLNINGLENLTKLKTLNLRGNPHFSEHMTAILLELKDKDVDVKYDYFDF